MMVGARIIAMIVVGVFIGVVASIIIQDKFFKKILIIISSVIFALTVVVVAQKVMHNDNRILIFYLYKLSSGSMSGALETNDYTLVMKSYDYKVGDIVTFKRGEDVITHRIVKIDGSKIITKGDANFHDDAAITKDVIIGKTVFHGKLLNALVSYLYFIIIAFVTTFLAAQLFINKPKGKYITTYDDMI